MKETHGDKGRKVPLRASRPRGQVGPFLWDPGSKLLKQLDAELDRLERRWSNATLPIGFATNALEAAMDLAWKAKQESDESTIPTAAQVKKVLRLVWAKNARRDAARAKSRRTLGLREETADPVDHFAQAEDRLYLSSLFEHLIESGQLAPVAAVFVSDLLGLDAESIANRGNRSLGTQLTPELVRQWRKRRFPGIRRLVRNCFNEILST